MDYQKIYDEALELVRKKDYYNALKLLEITKNCNYLYDRSLSLIITININLSNYKKARELIVNNSISDINYNMGLLEYSEYNIDASLNCFRTQLDLINPNLESNIISSISNIFLCKNDFKRAKLLNETLLSRYSIYGLIELVKLYLICNNFEEAFRLLNSKEISMYIINSTDNILERKKLSSTIYVLKGYTYYLLKSSKFNNEGYDNVYSLAILKDNNNDKIIEHLKKHIKNDNSNLWGYFFKYIDINKLFNDINDIVKNDEINGIYINQNLVYIKKLDDIIGVSFDEYTPYVKIVYTLKKEKMITMYPVIVSEKFDKENYTLKKER